MGRGHTTTNPQDSEQVMRGLLVLVLLLIIFVSLVGTVLLTSSIQDMKASRQAEFAQIRPPTATGYVGLSIIPPASSTDTPERQQRD